MKGFYRHYKGRNYQVVGEALDTRDDSLVVIYRTLYPSEYSLFSRPKEEFYGMVRLESGEMVPRFSPVDFHELPETDRRRIVEFLDLRKREEE